MLYISELCEDCAVANEIDYAWTCIHDNGTRDNGAWRLTLTAYYLIYVAITGPTWRLMEGYHVHHDNVRIYFAKITLRGFYGTALSRGGGGGFSATCTCHM